METLNKFSWKNIFNKQVDVMDISNAPEILNSRFRSGYYEDDEEEEGVDGIDTFLKNLPQILISVIVIMIAYFVWSFFNSPTGSALADGIGELVAMVAEMMQNWKMFFWAYILSIALPAMGRTIGSLANFFDRRSESKAARKFAHAQHNAEMIRNRNNDIFNVKIKTTEAMITAAREANYTEADMKLLFEELQAHEWVTVNPNDPSDWSINHDFKFQGKTIPDVVVNSALEVKKASADVALRDAEICARDQVPLFHGKQQFDNCILMYRMAAISDPDARVRFTQETIDVANSNFMDMLFSVDNVINKLGDIDIQDTAGGNETKPPPTFEQMSVYITDAINTANNEATFSSLTAAEQSTRQRTLLRAAIMTQYYGVGGGGTKQFTNSQFDSAFSENRRR